MFKSPHTQKTFVKRCEILTNFNINLVLTYGFYHQNLSLKLYAWIINELKIQKACDTVYYKIILAKLQHYGVRGVSLNWF